MTAVICLLLGALALIILTAWETRGKSEELKKLEEQKASDQTKLDELKKDESGLKSRIEKEQAVRTEEEKKKFWEEYVGQVKREDPK